MPGRTWPFKRTTKDALTPRGIRVPAISPGPVRTRVASDLTAFNTLMTGSTRYVDGGYNIVS